MMNRKVLLTFLLAAGAGMMAPGALSQSASPGDSGQMAAKLEETRALDDKRAAYEKRLAAMDIAELAKEMESDSSKGREPFNSAAYRQAVSRGEGVAADLKGQLVRPDRGTLIGLMALRKISPKEYQSLDPAFRLRVLVEALKNSKFFNTWGIPGLSWEDAANAIIAEGEAARPLLLPLLRDTRPAPVFGSEGATINREYHYRVCDYALALLDSIRQEKIELPTDPAERDRLIEREVNISQMRFKRSVALKQPAFWQTEAISKAVIGNGPAANRPDAILS